MRRGLGLTLLLVTAPTSAALTVLFDNGQTQALPDIPAAVATRPPATAAGDPPMLPIRTPELRVGRVTKRATPAVPYALRPTCVIGADPESLSWLQLHRQQLIKVNAYCWLVQAETVDDLKRVADSAGNLMVLPVSGAILRQAFGLRFYPVLVSAQWIEQ